MNGFADSFTTKKLCGGNTCATQTEFKATVQAVAQTAVPANTISSTPQTPRAAALRFFNATISNHHAVYA
jgi:hypothetical protein